jgi:hypothetical protein
MIRVAPMAAIPNLLREFGVPPGPFLKKFGLSEAAFSQPDKTVPFELLGRVINTCARETGCPISDFWSASAAMPPRSAPQVF